MNYKDFFKNKKIAVIGLGPHGEMIVDIKFLLRSKAQVSLYDIRSEKKLEEFLLELKDAGLLKYTLGKVIESEILESELIIISPEISKKSLFLKKATEEGVQIEFPDILFFKLVQPITFVGIMGSYGKSTVTHLIHSMLKKSFEDYEDQGLFFIDPDSSHGSLAHLKKIKKGDVVIVRIPESLMSHYYAIHISPHVAVITSVIPFKILEFQTHNNFIVAPDEVVDAIRSDKSADISDSRFDIKSKILRTRASSIPEDWVLARNVLHDRENAALALQTSELFKVAKDIAKDVIQGFSGLKGHIEMVKKVGAIVFYNDSGSVTPGATLSAIKSLSQNRNIVLIMGGAYTGYDYGELTKNLSQYVSTIILLSGSGTIGLRKDLEKLSEINFVQALSLEDAVIEAKDNAKKGDIVLFSPGFEAVGVDISRKERGERFVRAVRSL